MENHSNQHGGQIVVLVEDEALVRDVTACELEDRGFEVIEFDSADAALPWLTQNGGKPSIVVTDVQMPGRLNGLELVEIINDLWPRLKLLVTSGGPLVNPAALPPSVKFLAKPWRPAELVARVQGMLVARAL